MALGPSIALCARPGEGCWLIIQTMLIWLIHNVTSPSLADGDRTSLRARNCRVQHLFYRCNATVPNAFSTDVRPEIDESRVFACVRLVYANSSEPIQWPARAPKTYCALACATLTVIGIASTRAASVRRRRWWWRCVCVCDANTRARVHRLLSPRTHTLRLARTLSPAVAVHQVCSHFNAP